MQTFINHYLEKYSEKHREIIHSKETLRTSFITIQKHINNNAIDINELRLSELRSLVKEHTHFLSHNLRYHVSIMCMEYAWFLEKEQ